MRPDESQVPDAPASLEIGVHACRGFKGELLDYGCRDRRGDLGGRNRKSPQKSGARQHHRKAEPIVGAAQSSDEVEVGSVQMEVSSELVGRRFAIEASEPLALGVRKVTGGHVVRNFQLLRRVRIVPRNKAKSFAKHMREIKLFCSKFRTTVEAAA